MPSSASTLHFTAPLRRVGLNHAEIVAATRQEEIESVRKTAYQQGFEAATEFLNQQIAEQRTEVIQLVEQTFQALGEQQADLVRQLGGVLPGLATEIARRVLCGLEPNPERIERSVAELLQEMAHGTRDIEIALPPADLALIGRYQENFQDRYPGLTFVADPRLTVGDCRMKSGFGLVDARVATKLDAISRSLQ